MAFWHLSLIGHIEGASEFGHWPPILSPASFSPVKGVRGPTAHSDSSPLGKHLRTSISFRQIHEPSDAD
jgi:hypothetical protein